MNLHHTPSDTTWRSHFYPWVVIGFCALFLFYKYILQVSPSVMTDQLMRHFHVQGLGLGNLAATFFYAYLVTQFFAGPLLDKHNPTALTALAIAISALGALLFANAETLGMAMLARSVIGVGAAFATVSYFKMAALWFQPKQFALVGGLLATAAMIGSMVGQVPLAYLIEASSWRQSLITCGLLGIVLAALFFVFVRNKPRDSQPKNNLNSTLKGLTLRDFVTLLKQKKNWLLTFYSGLAFSPVAVFGGLWGDSFLQAAYHISKPTAASMTSLMFLGLAVGGPALGFLSDRLNKRYAVMFWGLILSLVCLSNALYYPNLPLDLEGTLLFLFGFGTGAFMIGFTIAKELNSVALAASVIGLINTGDALFGAFSEPLAGKLLDVFWQGKTVAGAPAFSLHDYHLSLLMLPVYLLLALVILVFLRKG